MMRIRPALRFALPLALLLGAAVAPALAEGTGQPKNEAAMRVYKSGDKFIVAIYSEDGSAALALVEPPKSRARGPGKGASKPDMADLMRNGRVIYTVNVAPKDTPADEPTDATDSAGKPSKGAPVAKLMRKQRSDLIKRMRSTAGILGTIGKGLDNGTEVGAATRR